MATGRDGEKRKRFERQNVVLLGSKSLQEWKSLVHIQRNLSIKEFKWVLSAFNLIDFTEI